METHVKVVGWLWIANGVAALLLVIIGLVVLNSPDLNPNQRDALFNSFGILGFSVPGIIADFAAGYGLLNLGRWARILAIILAVINLVLLCWLPLTAALAIYTLIIMFNKETADLFSGEVAPTKMATIG